ncbi:hypothetical protein ACOZ38_12095 [Sphaerisporangium viridialbum]|uniref:hypothetical protein n=1 Tax=Sphaerisporangium viridialbum TaxID=46189 RepID=UPI003C741D0C
MSARRRDAARVIILDENDRVLDDGDAFGGHRRGPRVFGAVEHSRTGHSVDRHRLVRVVDEEEMVAGPYEFQRVGKVPRS